MRHHERQSEVPFTLSLKAGKYEKYTLGQISEKLMTVI